MVITTVRDCGSVTLINISCRRASHMMSSLGRLITSHKIPLTKYPGPGRGLRIGGPGLKYRPGGPYCPWRLPGVEGPSFFTHSRLQNSKTFCMAPSPKDWPTLVEPNSFEIASLFKPSSVSHPLSAKQLRISSIKPPKS